MARRAFAPRVQAESEDSYFISMTDILVGLLFIFIILIVFFAILVGQENQELRKQQDARRILQLQMNLAEAKKAKEELEGQLERIASGAERRERDRASLVNGIAEALKDDGFKGLMPLAEKGVLSFEGKGVFDSGAYEINEDSEGDRLFSTVSVRLFEAIQCHAYRDKADLTLLGGIFTSKKAYPESEITLKDGRELVIFGRDCRIEETAIIQSLMIEGHTDNDPYRAAPNSFIKDNLDLSAQRALSVYRLMIEETATLLEYYNTSGEPIISFSGYGEDRPIAPNNSRDNKEKNRRTDLRFIMDSAEIPELENPYGAE